MAERGPRSVATYFGTMGWVANPLTFPFFDAFTRALGLTMNFTVNTIDKPGRNTARALMGDWMAPLQGYNDPKVALLVGLNSLQSHYGTPAGSPGKWLTDHLRAGLEVIVIDPRRTELAKRATLHLQPKAGEDAAILACLINVILDEHLEDRDFLDQHVTGVDRMHAAVKPFTPAVVGARAGLDPDQLVDAARRFARAGRGYAATGVGPGFAESSTLIHYLAMTLDTVCGHYLRAGETVTRAPSLLPPIQPIAQASSPRPAWGFGERLRVGGLTNTAAGLPTGVLPDEILLEGEGQVRALISCGGNPVAAWPDQNKTVAALKDLDLLVHFDPWMSGTARLADFIIAPTMPYEVPATTVMIDNIFLMDHWYGPDVSHAQYTEAALTPPAGSDVIEEWRFFLVLARRMGLRLDVQPLMGAAGPDGEIDIGPDAVADDLLELYARGSRVPLAEIKANPHGAAFAEPAVRVRPAEEGWTQRLDLGNELMMDDLADLAAQASAPHDPDFPFKLVGRRVQSVLNSSYHVSATMGARTYNPAYVHPADLEMLGLQTGDVVEIDSGHACIRAIVGADATLRKGVVAMTHSFGDESDEDVERVGSPVNRLLDNQDFTDPRLGMPRMGAVQVAIRRSA
jgi:anaerobic selenocysteine-containing dehydrogenase